MIEREILGCFIKDNSLISETSIQVNQFEAEAHRLLFQSMIMLAGEGKAIDKVTLLSANYEYLAQMGGTDFIANIETNGNIDNFETYEREFTERYKKRTSESRVNEWLSSQNEINDLIADLQKIDEYGIVDEVSKDDVLKDMHDLPFVEQIDSGIPSGLSDLDALTGGFQKHNSYVLGARPSMGKSATMLKFALSAAEHGAVPLMFSLEMSKESLIRRLIATVGNINLFLARNPYKLMDSKKSDWKKAVNALHKLDFEIYDDSMQTIQNMRSQVRKAKRKYGDKPIMVLIDYLTLIQSTGTYHSDHSKFTDISSHFKAMAKDYDCPVITLAQLSRGVEQRNDKRPMLSDLRESGSIEQDADMVMFLYRDSYYNKENDNNDLEINIAKHRDGATGTATVYYQKSTGKMADLSAY